MVDLTELQKRVYKNKIAKGFNVENVYMEFCYMYGEITEACEAYTMKKDDLGEELADVAIYLMGLAEILGICLEDEIVKKVEKNEKRQYVKQNGVVIKVSE